MSENSRRGWETVRKKFERVGKCLKIVEGGRKLSEKVVGVGKCPKIVGGG